jgi:hypothetical protein
VVMLYLFIKKDSITLRMVMDRCNHHIIELLLSASVDTKDVTAESWRRVYSMDNKSLMMCYCGKDRANGTPSGPAYCRARNCIRTSGWAGRIWSNKTSLVRR